MQGRIKMYGRRIGVKLSEFGCSEVSQTGRGLADRIPTKDHEYPTKDHEHPNVSKIEERTPWWPPRCSSHMSIVII